MQRAMKFGLQRRLLLLLALPLSLFAVVSVYFDYKTAGNVALQKDQQLLRLIPLLADSVLPLSPAQLQDTSKSVAPILMLAPEIADFVAGSQPSAGFRVSDASGKFLAGEAWIDGVLPTTREPEFHSIDNNGVTYRIAAQRVQTAAGELIVQLADGADPRQQWVRLVVVKVLLPNLALLLVAGFAVNWAVARALKPLLDVTNTVQQRSPRDLSAIDAAATPDEVKPLVLALNRLFALSHAQAESQRRFVADAAHQLRTPLAGLQAQVEAWGQAAAGAQTAKAQPGSAGSAGAVPATITLSADTIIKLRSATRRTSQLANQLLALSRADALGSPGQALQPVDLKELVEAILALYLDAAQDKNIDLGLQAEPAVASGHAWLLRELLCNLVDNAIKYTPAGGSVTLRCGVVDGPVGALGRSVFLGVVDNGPGIAPGERARVLERFYRVQGASVEGNGLGLAIADEIARVHKTQLVLADGCDALDSDEIGQVDARLNGALLKARGLSVMLVLQQENPHTGG